ncbi:DUF6069 family protein [Dactylosporangium sp. CA-233914]|uniref:DUF6069 family protein n=1 Tax=Dactylosporangium sp. CA-233914 TaxID=3239934 RepID=UPI003D923B33
MSAARRAAAVLGAVAAPAAIWLIAVPGLGHRLVVADNRGGPPLDVGLPVVVTLALLASLAGWALLAVLERLTRRAPAIWPACALVVLALSFAPLTGPGTPMSTKLPLALMHVAVAAVLIPLLRPTGRRRPDVQRPKAPSS